MKSKKGFWLCLLLWFMAFHSGIANMASPTWPGTIAGSAMSSRDIDILKEKIFIRLYKEEHTAAYKIDYTIKCDSSGKQIPLLFYAVDYLGDFNVWVDNQLVRVEEVSDAHQASLQKFEDALNSTEWIEELKRKPEHRDLKFFKVDLSEGTHQIHIEYISKAWVDSRHWVRKYSFRYSLFPAKFWRSFNAIEITLETSDNFELTTNLGEPAEGRLGSLATWRFEKLPVDEIELAYTPPISLWAKMLIAINPIGLTFLFFIAITIVHYKLIQQHRFKNPESRYSWVQLIGVIVVPFLIVVWFILTFDFIDDAIGVEAGKQHGYTFLAIIFYPVLMFLYWRVLRLIHSLVFVKRFLVSVYATIKSHDKFPSRFK